jgi:hypothetical protein
LSHQLPPVIKNLTFKHFSNLDQSMFARLIRLGVPAVQLDAQVILAVEIQGSVRCTRRMA